MRKLVVAVVLLLAVSATGWAAPSLFGPTGLILTPTADVIGTAGVNAQWAAIEVEDIDEDIVSANVGILAPLEVGVARIDVDGVGDETIINAKWKLVEPPLVETRLAIGVIDITDELDASPYLVLSHSLGLGYVQSSSISNPQVHVGVGGGIFDGLFAGLNFTVAKQVEIIAEYDSEDLNLGARLPLAKHFTLTAAGLDGFDDFAIAAAFSTAP